MDVPTLNRPELLWALVVVLPLLYWLALPPRPRRVLVTAHLPQWQRALQTLRRRPPRLRPLRLLLLLLAASALALAAAGPSSRGVAGPDRLVVLLDSSASMAAAADEAGEPVARQPSPPAAQDRFRQAVAAVRQGLQAVPEHVEVEVVQVGGGGLRRIGGPVARALADPAPPTGALPLALSELARTASRRDGTAVWTVTDGQQLDGASGLVGAVTCLGRPRANAAVLRAEVDDRWPLPELEVHLELVWFDPAGAAATGVLRVAGAVEQVSPQRVELPAAAPVRASLPLRRLAAGGEVRLSLEVAGDALPADDTWLLQLPPLPAPRIAVLAEQDGGVFVRAAAAALAAEVAGEVVPAAAGRPAGFLLIEGGRAAIEPGSAPFLAFGVQPREGGEPRIWPEPAVLDWDREDPLLAGLDLSELRIAAALQDALPAGRPLLWGAGPGGERRPLLALAAGEAATSLHFAFRLQDSNLGLLPAFPQLLRRAFLRGYGDRARLRAGVGPRSAREADLRAVGGLADRPLPAFGRPGAPLAPWCALGALVLLALRGLVR